VRNRGILTRFPAGAKRPDRIWGQPSSFPGGNTREASSWLFNSIKCRD